MCAKELLENTWIQRFLPAFVMAVFVTGGVYWQLSDMKVDIDHMQKDMETLKVDQGKDNDFRKSGERFSQHDGTQLELRNRDYTDKKIAETMVMVNDNLVKMNTAIIRLNDKFDEMK